MRNLLFIGILIFSLANCEKSDNEPIDLNGSWLEISHKTDTLVFDTLSSRTFTLYRGFELRNGQLFPKDLSGPYFYEISDNSIYLKWSGSSLGIGKNYYFHPDSRKEQFKIGNFFEDSLSENDILTFSKMP